MMIPSPLLQVVLINAVKDVAKALAELISATKCAAGKAADDPSMYQLKSAAKVSATEGPCLSMWKPQLQVAGTAAAPLTCRGGVGLLPPAVVVPPCQVLPWLPVEDFTTAHAHFYRMRRARVSQV